MATIGDTTPDYQPRNNMLNAPTIARYYYFIAGLMITINGFVSIGQDFNQPGVSCSGSVCVRPSLVWSSWTGGENDEQNAEWRGVFSLAPDTLLANWTGVFIGFVMMIVHLPGFKFAFCTRSWIHVSLFTLFAVLFAAFPYSGNLGVLVGFFTLPLCILALILQFTSFRNEPTTLLIQSSHFHCGCLANNEFIVRVARVMSLIGGFAVFVIGIIHIVVQDFKWCTPSSTQSCIGPSLIWNPSGQPFIRSDPGNGNANGNGWATIFTFAIDIFCVLWGPIILGVITILQHINGHTWSWLSASWPRVFLWFLFLGFFSGFGYAGNLGILVGSYCVFLAILAMAISLGGGGGSRTHLDIHIRNWGGKATAVSGGMQRSSGVADDKPSHNLLSDDYTLTDIRAHSELV